MTRPWKGDSAAPPTAETRPRTSPWRVGGAKSRQASPFVKTVREATGLADRVYVISSRPGHIRDMQTVAVPRPRHADDPALLAHQQRILKVLGEEVERVLRDELGETVHFPEAQHDVPPEQAYGMHI